MRRMTKFGLAALVLPVAALAYFAPNIRGYYRFEEICEKDGGLRVLGKLRKGVGWAADSQYGAASFDGVAFVRKRDHSGQIVDYRYKGGRPGYEQSYETTPAALDVPVVYEMRSVHERVPGELRLQKAGYEVTEIATGRLLVRWYQFAYSQFEPDRTILAAPSWIYCHSYSGFFEPSNYRNYFID